MIKLFKKSILYIALLIILSYSALGAPLDSSLYTGSDKILIQKYENLLGTLNKSKNNNYAAQKALLYALINILKYPDTSYILDVSSINVKNQDDYIKLLKRIAKLKLKYNEIGDRINKINKKLYVLNNNISALDENSEEVMTYQLQYAFYKITIDKLTDEKQALENNFTKWNNVLYTAFAKTAFEDKILKKSIENSIKKYNDLDNYIDKLNIEKDRLTLLNRSDDIAVVSNKLNQFIHLRDAEVLNIIDNYILINLSYLKNSKYSTKIERNIAEWTQKLTLENSVLLAEQEDALLYYIAKRKIGVLRTFINNIKMGSLHIIKVSWGFINKPIINVGNSHLSIFSIILALLIFIIGAYLGNTYKKRIKKANLSKNITLSTKTMLGNIGYYAIILIAFFLSLKILGINLSSLTVILGALSVGIGFGLQSMVSNFISGIILMLEDSIKIGDYIEISENLRGFVTDIQMRSSTILTNDHIEIIIPNQTLFQSNVINWTLTEKIKRFKIPFSVAYGTDVDKVEKVVMDALKNSKLNYIKYEPDKAPEIKMIAMGESSVDFNLDVWVRGDDVVYPRRTTSKFLIMIYNSLYENNIVIPFPQMDVHIDRTK